MPTVEELGKKVKAKYPGTYDDLDDRSIGVKVKSKFPGSYDDFEDTALNVTAPTIKPTSTPARDFDRALTMPAVTSAEKTPWEKFKDFAATPIVRGVSADVGDTPYNRGMEQRMRAARGYTTTEEIQPLPAPNRTIGKVLDERGGSATEGVARGVGNVASGLTSPMNLGLLFGVGALPKLGQAAANAAFTVEQATHIPEQTASVIDTFKNPEATSGDKAQALTEMAGSVALGALGARGAVKDFRTAPQVQRPMAKRIYGDFDAAEDIAYDLGRNRASRNAARSMMDSAAEGTQQRANLFELPPRPVPQGGAIAGSPPNQSISQVWDESMDRIQPLQEEINRFAEGPQLENRALPPRPVKSAQESARVFETTRNPYQDQITAFDVARKSPSQNIPYPPRSARKPVVPEEGPSIYEQRVADVAERLGLDPKNLTPEDRSVVENIVNERDTTRYKRLDEPIPQVLIDQPLPPKQPKGRSQEQILADINAANAAKRKEAIDADIAAMPRDTAVRLSDDGALVPDRPPTFQEAQSARRRERLEPLPPPPPVPEPQVSPLEAAISETQSRRPAPREEVVQQPVQPPARAGELPPRPTVSATGDHRSTAEALGYNPDALSPREATIVRDLMSPNEKVRTAAIAKWRRSQGESGMWKPFVSKPPLPGTSEAYAAEMVEKREAARRAFAKSSSPVRSLDPARRLWISAKSNVIDTLSPMDDLLDEAASKQKGNFSLRPSQEFEGATAKALRSPSLARQFAKDNGLEPLIQGFKTQADLDNFEQLLIARHAEEIARENPSIKTGRDAARDAQLVADFAPRYQKELAAYGNYVRKLEDYMVETGLKSQAEIDALRKKYPDYADFHRVVAQDAQSRFHDRAIASKSSTNVIQKLVGSDKLEIDTPLGNLLNKTEHVFSDGERNRAARAFVENADTFFNNTPQADRPVFRLTPKMASRISADNKITYLDGGKPVEYYAPKEVVEAAKQLKAEQMGLLGRVFFNFVRVFKAGTTGIDVPFAVGNIIRDQATRTISQRSTEKTAQHLTLPPKAHSITNRAAELTGINSALAKATVDAVLGVGKNELGLSSWLYDEMVRNAAGGTSFDMYRNQPTLTVQSIRANKNPKTRAINAIQHPVRSGLREIENLIGTSESTTRLQVYAAAKADALKRGLPEAEAQAIAAKAARQTTADFYRGGNWKRPLMVVFPYMNAGIQGTRQSLRAAQSDPLAFATRASLTVGLPIAAAVLWNTATPERKKAWDDIQDWEKDKSLIILPENPTKGKDGRYDAVKFPLAPGISEMGVLVRRNMEARIGGDPVKASEYFNAMFNFLSPLSGTGEQMVGQTIPQVVKPAIEATFNRNFYTNRPIEPEWMEHFPVEDKRFPSTSGIGQMIGEATNTAPVRVDHILKGIGGGVTGQVLHYADRSRKAIADQLPGNSPSVQYLRELPVGGESLPGKLERRFLKAQGGAVDEREIAKTNEAAAKVAREYAPADKLARQLFREWEADPVATDAKINKLIDEGKLDDRSIKTLEKLVDSHDKDMSRWEKHLAAQPAAVRAQRIFEMVEKNPDDFEKIRDSLLEKKILTPAVIKILEEMEAKP